MRLPCKDCPDRHIGCHSECEKYIAFRRERDAYNEKHAMEVAILCSINKRIADTNREAEDYEIKSCDLHDTIKGVV